MTSILNLSGLNYSSSNPLRAEMNTIRDYIGRVEKSVKELAAGSGGGAITGAKGITAGLKEVALQIVNLRSEIDNIKANITRIELSADSQHKKTDKAIADIVTRLTLVETMSSSNNKAIKTINSTLASLTPGGSTDVAAATTNDGSDLLSAITEALAEVNEEVQSEVVASVSSEVTSEAPVTEVVEANTQEDEAASEEILALLRA